MAAPSVRAESPPEQDDRRLIAERFDRPHWLRIYETDDPSVAVLRRYRVAASPPYDVVAEIAHAGGVVSKFSWDEWHRVKALSDWRAPVEAWIRAKIAEDWAS
jgi:hypothetical protein